MFLSAIWLSLCFSSLMYRLILPLVVLVPNDSNVAVDTQVWFRYSMWISSVAGISKILCTPEVACATHILICENVRHLRLGTNFSCVVCSEESKYIWFLLTKTANDNLCKITKFTRTSSVWNFRQKIADVLLAKRHSGRERRWTAVFAGYKSSPRDISD